MSVHHYTRFHNRENMSAPYLTNIKFQGLVISYS